jgi:hypothetical protein
MQPAFRTDSLLNGGVFINTSKHKVTVCTMYCDVTLTNCTVLPTENICGFLISIDYVDKIRTSKYKYISVCNFRDRLCGLVVRVPGYRSSGSGFDSRRYQIFWELVGLEWCSLSLVSTIEEVLGKKSNGSGLEIRKYGRRDPSRWPDTLYPQKLALTSPTSGGCSVGIVRRSTQATAFFF